MKTVVIKEDHQEIRLERKGDRVYISRETKVSIAICDIPVKALQALDID